MINPVSASGPVPARALATNTPKTQSVATVAKPVEDTVHLSPQAQAAAKGAGDVDHDGDRH